MAELLNYLENSTLVANIISFVVLGFAGVLVRSIIKGVGALAENKAELEKVGRNSHGFPTFYR